MGQHEAHFWEMLAFLQGKPCMRIEARQRIGRLVREGRTLDALFIALWADWQDARDEADAREMAAMPREVMPREQVPRPQQSVASEPDARPVRSAWRKVE